MSGPFPHIEPYESGMPDGGDGHQVYWECCGDPAGKPALYLHGGPGSGCYEDEQLWPGDFVNTKVSLDVLRGALTIPSAAIQVGPNGKFAWVVAEGDVVQARPITPGPTTDGRTMITLGLVEGERVVVSGQYKLRQNSKVTVTSPAPAVAKQALAP